MWLAWGLPGIDVGAEDLRALALLIGVHFGGAFRYGDLRDLPADELVDLAAEVERKVKERPNAGEA